MAADNKVPAKIEKMPLSVEVEAMLAHRSSGSDVICGIPAKGRVYASKSVRIFCHTDDTDFHRFSFKRLIICVNLCNLCEREI